MYQSKPWDREGWKQGFKNQQENQGLCVELGGRLILVTHWYLFCKVTHHYSETEGCSLPQTRSIWTELGKQIILCSLLFFLSLFFYFWLVFKIVPYTLFWLFDYHLLHTSSLLLVWFFHRIHNNSSGPNYRRISFLSLLNNKCILTII